MSKQSEFFTIPNTREEPSGYLGVQAYELHPDDLSDKLSSIDEARELLGRAKIDVLAKDLTPQEQIGSCASNVVVLRTAVLEAGIPFNVAA